MSKHLKALGKLRKNVLGLSTANLDTEIKSLSERRDNLPTLIYEKTDEAIAAEVLSNMVDKYHLKEVSLIKREEEDRLTGNITTKLGFPSDEEVTTFIEVINEELSAKCETQTVIDSAKKKVNDFFAVNEGGWVIAVKEGGRPGMEPIGGSIDGDTISSITNYQRFNDNAYNYADSSKYLDFINLVEKGDLKLEFEFELTNPHFNTLSYTYTLNSEEFGLEPLSDSKETPDGAISNEKGNIVIIKSDKENVYNVFTNLSATGTPVTTTTYDLNKESFSNFVVEVKEGLKVTYSLTFKNAGPIAREFKLPTKKSFEVVERLALAYRDTYIKKYTEYLPDFAQLKYFLNQELEYEFGKYEPRIPKEGGVISDFEKLRSNYTQFTNDIIELITYLFYGNLSKSKRINSIENYRKNISIAVLNLGTQNDNSKNILRTYGEDNLTVVKDSLNSLNKENDEIDTKITTLQTEKTTINEFDLKRREQLEDLDELLGGVDTTFIDKAGLSDGSIISAKSAHTETLKIYSGARVDKIIKEAIAEGKFEVEVFNLTDIEAKLLLDGGYYIKETTEPKKSGNRVIEVTTWTINWESANSILGKEAEVPKEPLP